MYCIFLQFRAVVDPIEINFENYIQKLNGPAEKMKVPIHCECFEKVADGVYYNQNVTIKDNENAELLKRILNENELIEFANEEEKWQACVDAVEDLFEKSKERHAYIRDIEIEPDESNSLLSNIKSHISINAERNIEEMAGINTSMHYFGERGSFTAHHEEDGGLSSLNLLKCGNPKLWFIIDYRWRAQVEKEIADYLRRKTPEIEVCDQVLKHKIYLITPNLLEKLNIPYSIVVQNPGDLFFIRKGTYHSVINMGRNIAEAINYGCNEWNSGYKTLTCSCQEGKKADVEQDKTVVITFKASEKRLIQCECGELFITKKT